MMIAMTEMTTKYGPHGHVHPALNFISLSGRPWRTQARRNFQLERPIETHAICNEHT